MPNESQERVPREQTTSCIKVRAHPFIAILNNQMKKYSRCAPLRDKKAEHVTPISGRITVMTLLCAPAYKMFH
jgi:hypothetical protein